MTATTTTLRTAAGAAALCLAGGLASAQTSPAQTDPAQTIPAPRTDLDAKPGTLSDKLGETGGVIKPTGDVDPAMHKAAPQTGSMPTVKPGQVPPQSGTGTGKGGLY